MVFYFMSSIVSPPYKLFMGADKYESKCSVYFSLLLKTITTFRHKFEWNAPNFYRQTDEHLIKWGFPEDVWFHVDKLSSAHVYLRLQPVRTVHSQLSDNRDSIL